MNKITLINIFRKSIALLMLSAVTLFQSTGVLAQATQHLKKDGTPDKRYGNSNAATSVTSPAQNKKEGTAEKEKGNKTAASSTTIRETPSIPANSPVTKTSAAAQPAGAHLKANGTPDKRYTTNSTAASPANATVVNGKHLKKDGTPDMRYKENKHPK